MGLAEENYDSTRGEQISKKDDLIMNCGFTNKARTQLGEIGYFTNKTNKMSTRLIKCLILPAKTWILWQKNLAGRTLVTGVAQRVDLELQMGYGGMW